MMNKQGFRTIGGHPFNGKEVVPWAMREAQKLFPIEEQVQKLAKLNIYKYM